LCADCPKVAQARPRVVRGRAPVFTRHVSGGHAELCADCPKVAQARPRAVRGRAPVVTRHVSGGHAEFASHSNRIASRRSLPAGSTSHQVLRLESKQDATQYMQFSGGHDCCQLQMPPGLTSECTTNQNCSSILLRGTLCQAS